MMNLVRLAALAVTGIALGLDASAVAQTVKATTPGKGGSPHETVEWKLDGANLTVSYGRPFTKGRKIFGELHPYGTVWRTGADEATTLVIDPPGASLMFGKTEVPAGTYTLYTLLGEKSWKLIINRQTGQSGTVYTPGQDLARIDMKTERLPKPVEQHTISIDKTPSGGLLKIAWEHTRASVPFTIKKP